MKGESLEDGQAVRIALQPSPIPDSPKIPYFTPALTSDRLPWRCGEGEAVLGGAALHLYQKLLFGTPILGVLIAHVGPRGLGLTLPLLNVPSALKMPHNPGLDPLKENANLIRRRSRGRGEFQSPGLSFGLNPAALGGQKMQMRIVPKPVSEALDKRDGKSPRARRLGDFYKR